MDLKAKIKTFVFTALILMILGVLITRGCRFDWNPHYLDNNAIKINKKLYSPDSSIAVVYYTLDVGARGYRQYKSILREEDYDDELTTFNVPPEMVVVNWVDNHNLKVVYDLNEIYGLGGIHTDLDLTKDTIIINGIKLIVAERKTKESYVP
ncbi:hypothetical protein [Echinicola salinicaeni]|uniref:hypothetical protein n=1 Tax=Echinicola salinicaeni TaxID=2762757 RepID=UPI001649436E|nr:hypothetical protein [Echinicola salinicaeni]